jgi:hypothetical protein
VKRPRLGLLLVLALLFGGALLWFHDLGRTRHVQNAEVVDGALPAEAPVDGFVREPSARIDQRVLEEVRDGSRMERLIREPGDGEELRADPVRFRGAPLDVKGTLESLEVTRGERFHEFRGTLRDRHGGAWAFTVLREPEVSVGDVVRLQGFFLKLSCLENGPGRYEDEVPLLVGRELKSSYFALEPSTELSAEMLAEIRDGDLVDMTDRQEDILYHVLNYARSLTPERLATLPIADVTWADLRADPDRYRGKLVRLIAKFPEGFQWEQPLGPDGENPLGVAAFVEGIMGAGEHKLVRWIADERIRDDQVGDFRNVHLTGVFFKTLAWENKRGVPYSGPLIVPVSIEPFTIEAFTFTRKLGWFLGGAALVIVLVFWLSVFADGRRAREFRQEYVQRRKRSLARVLGRSDSARDPAGPEAGA